MDSITCEKKDSSHQVSSQNLIDGTINRQVHTLIQESQNPKYCSFEEHLTKDFSSFCKANSCGHDYLFLTSNEQQSLSPTFKLLSFLELQEFYQGFSKKSIHKEETRELAFFSLLCLRELLNRGNKNDLDVTIDLLELHIKYIIYKSLPHLRLCSTKKIEDFEKPRDILFNIDLNSYNRPKNANTFLDSYRLGKIGYKIIKKKKL
jgi:hypothetical protein